MGEPESEAGSVARARRRFAVRTSGEVVAGTDLLVLAVAVAVFAPAVLQWPVAVFVLGVLGGLRPPGSVRLAHHPEREQGPGHGGGGRCRCR